MWVSKMSQEADQRKGRGQKVAVAVMLAGQRALASTLEVTNVHLHEVTQMLVY